MQSTIRIIAGEWRRRRVPVPVGHQVRPSGDRARETLFNWLAPYISGARCLDLYAGSGVLAFEALSRGAKHACLLDKDHRTINQITETARDLKIPPSQSASIIHTDATSWLMNNRAEKFDVIFLDPPFDSGLLEKTLDLLVPDWLTDSALVYVETGGEIEKLPLPGGLEWTKRSQIGNVGIGLAAKRVEIE
jgi:16S rRNA (guanine966-N2)-methyltransferase